MTNIEVRDSETLLNISFHSNLTQIVNECTQDGKTTKTYLDLIFISEKINTYAVTLHKSITAPYGTISFY